MLHFLTGAFYAMSIIFIWHEFNVLVDPETYSDLSKKSHELSKGKDDETRKQREKFLKENWTSIITQVFYFFWTFLGLISCEWFLFAAIIVLSIIGSVTKSRTSKYYLIFDAALSIVILATLLIDKYHFGYFKNFIQL